MTKELFLRKPQAVVRDKRLSPGEGDYLCLIAQLHRAGGCTASNNYFADYFAVKRQTAQGILGALKGKGFIATSEKKSGGKTVERTIEIIDPDSRLSLLLDSRESPAGLAGKPVKVSRKSPTHTIELQERLQRGGRAGDAAAAGKKPLTRAEQIAEEERTRQIIQQEAAAGIKPVPFSEFIKTKQLGAGQ